jgi:hypothetical protein
MTGIEPAVCAKERHVQCLQEGNTLEAWCARWLGAKPISLLFEVARLSLVTGLRLADGREVVIKARPPAEETGGWHALGSISCR